MRGVFLESRSAVARKEVLIVCFSLAQLPMALNLVVCSDLSYVILVDKIDQTFIARYALPDNVYITADRDIIAGRIESIQLVISTVTLAAPAHEKIFNLYAEFKKRQISILEIQHGLFQWGINFKDTSKILSFESLRYGAGEVASHATDKALWFGDDGIGYPRVLNRAALDKIVAPKFILIATNLHWHIYSDQERLKFISIIKKTIESLPESLFVWHPHPAEAARGMLDIGYAGLNALRCKNLLLYGVSNDFYIPSITQLEELAYLSSAGLVTTGTAIIDYELAGRPVAVFDCNAVAELNGTISTVPLFSSSRDAIEFLHNKHQPPTKTGFYKEFCGKRFAVLTKKLLKSLPISLRS